MNQGLSPAAGEKTRTLRICIDASHPALAGHFPGNPIVPAALLLAEIDEWLANAGVRVIGVRRVRFAAPVRPGDVVEIECRAGADGEQRFDARVGDAVVARGSLAVREDAHER